MIALNDVVKSFGPVRALDGLSMSVPKGAVYGLVGPNGAGKTTALQHIAGIQKPESGVVLVDGTPIFENVEAKARVAFVPSDIFYPGQARVADMMSLHASLYPGFSMERFGELEPLFQIDRKATVRSLSKGMKKQVAFWLALSRQPDLLLLDEPLDGLDPVARRKVWSVVMEDVAERNMTVLTSSHNLRELTDVCDYVGMMEKGRMRLEHTLADLQEGFVKVQVAFVDDQLILPEGLPVLSQGSQGRLFTLVVRGSAEQVESAYRDASPQFLNILPLSLEEIFVYELGGEGDGRISD